MTAPPLRRSGMPRTRAACAILMLAVAVIGWPVGAAAQGPTPVKAAPKPIAEQGVRWSELKPPQQAALQPLERDWSSIDAPRKQKWIELAARFPKLAPAEQARVQQRMAQWVQLTPQERGQARLNFQEAKELSPQARQERWAAYQALSPERKHQLAERAQPNASGAAARNPAEAAARADSKGRDAPQPKSNIVPNPALAAQPRPIGPTIVQASPGATTTLITKRPAPPSHQQTGLPKIAATPEFVNKATLLPQRGPQGAAMVRSATAASAAGEPVRRP